MENGQAWNPRQHDHYHLPPRREIEQNNGCGGWARKEGPNRPERLTRTSGISIPPQDGKHRFPGGFGTHSGF